MAETDDSDELRFVRPTPNVGVGTGVLLLNQSDRILLVRRPFSLETDRGEWSQPGGRLEFAQEPQTAIRDLVARRFGLTLPTLDLLTVHTHMSRHLETEVQWISICYLCTDFTPERRTSGELSMPNWEWFPLTNLPSSLTNYTVATIAALLKRLHT